MITDALDHSNCNGEGDKGKLDLKDFQRRKALVTAGIDTQRDFAVTGRKKKKWSSKAAGKK